MRSAKVKKSPSFFREPKHFEYFAKEVVARAAEEAGKNGKRIRVWSAGCSTGEEPYSIAITIAGGIPGISLWDAKILATDLSTKVLGKAAAGLYKEDRLKTVSPQLRSKYFSCVEVKPEKIYRVGDDVRRLVHFGRLNLMEHWPMRGTFNAIFCRNVMIYFDKPTQEKLVGRFWDVLVPGGVLFLGHSESLTGIRHRFGYVQPTVYRKP